MVWVIEEPTSEKKAVYLLSPPRRHGNFLRTGLSHFSIFFSSVHDRFRLPSALVYIVYRYRVQLLASFHTFRTGAEIPNSVYDTCHIVGSVLSYKL